MRYPCKGNVRELENIIELTLLMTEKEEIHFNDLPEEIRVTTPERIPLPRLTENGADLDALIAEVEKQYLLEALEQTKGSKTEAAKLLKMTFRSFRHRLQKYGIK